MEIDAALWRRFLSYGDSNLLACHADAAIPRLSANVRGLDPFFEWGMSWVAAAPKNVS